MSAVAKIRELLPPNTVNLENGKVVRLSLWTLWNGVPWNTVVIERTAVGFSCSVGEPEHGGGRVQGDLDEVLAGFHPDIKRRYKQLFELNEPTGAQLKEFGFL